MSLMSQIDCRFRAEDQAYSTMVNSPEDSLCNPFDDFFDKELYDLTNDESNKGSPYMHDFFPAEYNEVTDVRKVEAVPVDETPQPWRKGLWCLKSETNSELPIEQTRRMSLTTQKFISPTHLLGNDNYAMRHPIPFSVIDTKTTTLSPKANHRNKGQRARHNIIREKTLSPTPMYAQISVGKMMDCESWQQDLQNVHLQMPDNGIYLSSQGAGHQMENGLSLRQANFERVAQNATTIRPSQSPKKYHYPFNNTPNSERGRSRADQTIHEPTGGTTEYETDQTAKPVWAGLNQFGAPIWTTESLHSSDSSQYSHESQVSSDMHSQRYANLIDQAWLPPPASSAIAYAQKENVLKIAAPKPQRALYQMLHQQQKIHDGLGIHYTDVDEIGQAVPYNSTHTQDNRCQTITPPPLPAAHVAYPPLPPYPHQFFSETSPFATPRRNVTSFSRSPSPSSSPSRRATSLGPTQRSPSRNEQGRSRRKSLHKAGPIKDTSLNLENTHRRARSSSRPPRTPKTPTKTPTSASFNQIDFVNYTPKDSMKLMTDVAPSGSSKTRARREQEAKDKRKRLSEAALQAVRRAGGDVRVLEEAIFV